MTPSSFRPMGIGDILDAAFRMFRMHFLTFIGIVAVPVLLVTIIQVALMVVVSPTVNIENFQSFFAVVVIGGALINAAARVKRQEQVTSSSAYLLGFRRYLSIAGALFLQGLVIALPVMIILIIVFFSAFATFPSIEEPFAANSAPGLGFVLIMILLLVCIVPVVLYLALRWYVALVCVVVEGCNAAAALGRSWSLTRGSMWRIFGVAFITGLLMYVVGQLPAQLLGVVAVRSILTSGNETNMMLVILSTYLVGQFGLILTLPLQYIVQTLVYYDLRARNEGYDLEVAAQQMLHERKLV